VAKLDPFAGSSGLVTTIDEVEALTGPGANVTLRMDEETGAY
jgi:hypothetical protein